jgi:N-methylhydantoinase A
VIDRATDFEMAYNPNDCVELRWGAPANSDEASTCKRHAPQAQRAKMCRITAPGSASGTGLRIGIDTGGTFTDIVCVDDRSGAMRVTKVSSTPSNPAVALVRGVHAILGEWGASVDDLGVLAHGTTVATNALLQGEIEGLGLIVTSGFRHILEIARQAVPEGYGNSYFWVKPERIVPLRHVREVGGRLNFLGEELRPLDEDSVRAAARYFRTAGINAVGVCLIHSYANPAHERRAAEIVREEYPACTLSLSCDVLPEYREYERAVTTLVDAFIKPHMSRYLDRIRDELGPALNKKPFLVMQSSGGVASPDQVMRKPITTALSGPAAGALGSAVIAEIAGFPDLVTLDGGGTSTDLCLIEAAKPKITNGGRVGQFPVRIPMLDVRTIGTGGGSIAWLSRESKLKVGPRSAGAVPGTDVLPERRQRADADRCHSRPRPHSAGADRRRHCASTSNARAAD